MITRVTGVLVDGSTPSSGSAAVPSPQQLLQPAGEDSTILIGLINSARVAVPLTGVLIFSLRRRVTDFQPVVVREGTVLNVNGGQGAFALLAADTMHLPADRYWYDVFYSDHLGNRSQVIPVSAFDVRPVVGRPGEPTSVPGVEPPAVPADDGILALCSENSYAVIGQNEDLVAQTTFNFGLLETPNVYGVLTGLTEQTGGATGTYRVRYGGTYNQADGPEVLMMDTTNANWVVPPNTHSSAAFARPSGPQLVKLTARASFPGATARIRAFQIAFKTVA
jgi:hypothetical protein